MKKFLLSGLLLILFGFTNLYSYAFNPWGGITGKNTFGITPFLYVNTNPSSVNADLFLNYGWSEKGDVFVNILPLSISPTVGYGNITIMPRYNIVGNLILAVPLYIPISGGSFGADIAMDYNKFFGKSVQLQINAGYSLPLQGGIGSLYSYIAGDYYFSNYFGIYLEVDPSYDFDNKSLGLGIVPGVFVAFDKDQTHSISVGALTDVSNGFSFNGVGMWYYTSFSL